MEKINIKKRVANSKYPVMSDMSAGLVLLMVLSVVGLICIGCETHAEQKQAMHDHWDLKSAEAQLPLAREHFEGGRFDEAKEILDVCFKADAYMPEANLLMGKVVMEEGHLDQAHIFFSTVVEVDNQNDEAYYWLGVIAQKSGSLSESIDYHTKASLIKPVEIKYIEAVADSLVSNGEVKKALDYLNEKSSSIGRSSRLKIAMADIYQYQGEIKEAISLYRQALLLDGDDPEVMTALGYCYVAEKNWGLAIDFFEKLIDEKKEGEELTSHLEILAKCCMSNGDYGKAMDYYNKLSVHKRQDPTLWLQMGNAALGANSSGRAMSCADKAMSLKPGWSEAIALKGSAMYMSGEYRKGIEMFSHVLSDEKLSGFAWVMTGRCYEKLNMTSQAQRAYDKAKDINPTSEFVILLDKTNETEILGKN